MRQRYGYGLMGLGLILLCAAGGLFWWNRAEETRAADAAARICEIMTEEVYITPADYQPETDVEQAVTIDGNAYIGELALPSLGITLPVMEQWSYAGMQIAPGRYAGSVTQDDLIVAGHNYAGHFGRLQDLQTGDAVTFTDVLGGIHRYTVSQVEVVDGKDVAAMKEGEWDLTLFTCTYSGADRVTVRCKREALSWG